MIWARDLDGTGSLHICSEEDEGAITHIPINQNVKVFDDGGMITYVGKWKCGEVVYRLTRRKGDPKAWSAQCRLPGVKAHLGDFQSVSDAQLRVEHAIRHWLERLNEEPKK